MYLHKHRNFKELVEITAKKQSINSPYLVEKDYWIMHCLYGLSKLNLSLELKGGTSLSKAYNVIHRFSEDIDIKINPSKKVNLNFKVYDDNRQGKEKHRKSREKYFNWLSTYLEDKIDGVEVKRDTDFDDIPKYRSAGIRLSYKSHFSIIEGIKDGVLLEVGFDQTTPNQKKDISSWAFEEGFKPLKDEVIDNRARNISCYDLRYTFVEKLQAITRKYNTYIDKKNFPKNFLRHYYDLHCLLQIKEVKDFIGTKEYKEHKKAKFKTLDTVIKNCEGFTLSDPTEYDKFKNYYQQTASLYYKGQTPFKDILNTISKFIDIL